MARPKKEKRMNHVYEDIKKNIVENRLKPGQMLGEESLAALYQVSRTPIREALHLLEGEGLVEVRDGVGTFVTEFSREDIENAYEIRRTLEVLAVKSAIHHFSEDDLERFESEFKSLYKSLREGMVTIDDFARADWDFHDAILNKSENPFIPLTLKSIGNLLRRYQYVSVNMFASAEEALQEHLLLIDLIRKKAVDQVVELLEKHLYFN